MLHHTLRVLSILTSSSKECTYQLLRLDVLEAMRSRSLSPLEKASASQGPRFGYVSHRQFNSTRIVVSKPIQSLEVRVCCARNCI